MLPEGKPRTMAAGHHDWGDGWVVAPMITQLSMATMVGATLLGSTGTPTLAAQNDYPAKDSGYHNYPEMVQALKAAEAAHPDIVRVFSIGRATRAAPSGPRRSVTTSARTRASPRSCSTASITLASTSRARCRCTS